MLLTITSLLCAVSSLSAQSRISSEYLKGAVPMQEGEIVFRKSFNAPGMSRDSLMSLTREWINGRENQEENRSCRVLIFDEEKGSIVAGCSEKLVFRSSMFLLDQSDINYNIHAICTPESVNMTIIRIRYKYDNERYTAEEIIADEVSLRKNQTEISRSSQKWRIKTIDFVKDLFNDYHIFLSDKK